MILKLLQRVDFWIYVAMAILFLTGVVLCFLPLRRVTRALRQGRNRLSERREDGRYAYTSPEFLRCRELDGVWGRFLSNLECMRRNNSTCEVTEFINRETVIYGPGHSTFGEMIPGLLTTLGIVGSFYGIVTGLSTLDLTSTVTMSESIAVLIQGMRTAFNTSIAGAVLALVFQILRRMVIGSTEKALREFVNDCQKELSELLTPDASLMQTLHQILAELRMMNTEARFRRE